MQQWRSGYKKRHVTEECLAPCFNNLPLSKSHHQDGSSGSHAEVQSIFFPEASGPSLALLTRLCLRKRKGRDKDKKSTDVVHAHG